MVRIFFYVKKLFSCSNNFNTFLVAGNTIEVVFGCDVDYEIDEKTADIDVKVKSALPDYEHDPTKRYAVSGVIEGYYLQLMDMLEDYYDYLDVNLEDKEF